MTDEKITTKSGLLSSIALAVMRFVIITSLFVYPTAVVFVVKFDSNKSEHWFEFLLISWMLAFAILWFLWRLERVHLRLLWMLLLLLNFLFIFYTVFFTT